MQTKILFGFSHVDLRCFSRGAAGCFVGFDVSSTSLQQKPFLTLAAGGFVRRHRSCQKLFMAPYSSIYLTLMRASESQAESPSQGQPQVSIRLKLQHRPQDLGADPVPLLETPLPRIIGRDLYITLMIVGKLTSLKPSYFSASERSKTRVVLQSLKCEFAVHVQSQAQPHPS